MIVSKSSQSAREDLRRAAAAADQGPTGETQSGGAFPYNALREMAGEPHDPTNVSFPFLRRMRRDHMVALGLHLIEMGLLKAPWYIDCQDARAAAMADGLIRPIYGRLMRTILRFLWAGFSPGVKRFKFIDDPGWIYYQGGEAKKVWDNGRIQAAVFRPVLPLKPELCRPIWKGGDFDGINYDSRYDSGDGMFVVDGLKTSTIDLSHAIWATHGMEGESGSIYGFPRIAHCSPIFHMYWYIWSLIGRAFENNADPGPVMRYPQDAMSQENADGTRLTPVETALLLGRRRRSGSTVALPSDPYTTFDDRPSASMKWGIEYPKNETNFDALISWLGILDSAKMIGLWIPPAGATGDGVTGSSSSRNVVTELGNLRDESQFVLMAMIDEFIDNVFIRPALAMNMPEFEGSIHKRTLGLSKDDEDVTRQFFQLVGQQDWRNFGVDVQRLAESRGLPMLDPTEREKQLQQSAAQVEQGGPPVVEPTQGRRALVTQTGFGETAYVQLEEPITMAEDGDYVAGLPRTDHFSDSAVLSQSRLLRSYAKTLYSGLYEDFAIYVSKRRSLGLAEGDDWIDRLIKSWRPRAERAKLFAQRTRRTLASIFDRTASLKLRELGSDKSVNASTDARAARWLEQHGAELVGGVTETVRSDLRKFLAREVKKGATSKEVAEAIRSNFSQWPSWEADRLARSETTEAWNFGVLSAGHAAGIKKVQLIDGEDHDKACADRNGKVVSITDAFKEHTNHPRCTLAVRLLPQTKLEVVRAQLDDGLQARFDEPTSTILLSPDIDAAEETKFMLALGQRLAMASPNGKPTEESSFVSDD